jgi:hypothetical protein
MPGARQDLLEPERSLTLPRETCDLAAAAAQRNPALYAAARGITSRL